MPVGVEHSTDLNALIAITTIPKPLMPVGVEHSPMHPEVPGTFDS